MQKIFLIWGSEQEKLLTFGTAGESCSTEFVIDVSKAESRIPGAVYSINIKRADGWTYPAEVGLKADSDLEITYVLDSNDLAVYGSTWMIVVADATTNNRAGTGSGEARASWSVVGWVAKGAYDGSDSPRPDWVSEVMAFANSFGEIKAKISLLPPNAKPAAAFVQESDGMKLVLSLPDTSGAGDGGRAIFSAEDEADLTSLTQASIGDQAITTFGDVYMCVGGDPTSSASWVRLSDDKSGFDRFQSLIADIELNMKEVSKSLSSLEQSVAELNIDVGGIEQTVGEIALTLLEARHINGIIMSDGTSLTKAVPGQDYLKSTTPIDFVLESEKWVDNQASVTNELISSQNNLILKLAPYATAEQYLMYAAALPWVTSNWEGGCTITALGTTPDGPLPLRLSALSY